MSYYFAKKLAVFHKTCGTKTKWGRPARSVPRRRVPARSYINPKRFAAL